MKIIHIGDIHYSEKDHNEIKKCMDFAIKETWKVKPDIIICPGDIINSQYLGADTKSLKTVQSQFREFSDIAPVAVVAGTFSHDGLAPELLKNVSGKYPIHVSTKPEQIILCDMRLDGHPKWYLDPKGRIINPLLVVSQVPPPTKEHWVNRKGIEKDNQNISSAMTSIFANFGVMAKKYNAPHILNGHFSVQGCKISETQLLPGTDISIGKEILSMANADLYCLGHIHMKQEYQITSTTKAFHSGSIFRKNFGERNEDKGFYIHTLTGNDHDLDSYEFIKTPTRHMHQVEFDLIKEPWNLDDENQTFSEKAFLVCKPFAEIQSFIKIKITVWMDEIKQINQAKIKRDLLEAGASDVTLEIDRIRRENSREDEIIKAVNLPEKAQALASHRSQPMPEGCKEMFEQVESLNGNDLVSYALNRL